MKTTFYEKALRYSSFDFNAFNETVTENKIKSILARDRLNELDYLTLISDNALPYLELIAQRAHTLTKKHFGNVIFIFTPIYISNYCDSVCPYCSFACQHEITRKHLDFVQIEKEAQAIRDKGIRHVLMLTGESRRAAPVEYLEGAIEVLKKHFSSIAIEIYPLTSQEYSRAIRCGVDALTIYQETYNEPLYHRLHKGGPKDNYRFRLEAPERACSEGIRSVTVGALLGLDQVTRDAFFSGLHAAYLMQQYPGVEVSGSFPRLRPQAGEFVPDHEVSDKKFVQIMTAFRVFLPSAGITVSTRESSEFRTKILPLGVTKMSAGVSTAVGGHSELPSTSQFEIADTRSVDQMSQELLSLGYQPVLHDWDCNFFRGSLNFS